MEKKEFTIESRDGHGTKVWCTEWIPDGKPVLILQIMHGMAEYIDRYDGFATFLAEHGVLVTGEDMLGHGRTAMRAEGGEQNLGFFCDGDPATVVVRDEHRLKKTVQAEYPGVPYFVMGHSMGSFVARNYISRYGTGIQGAIIMGTGQNPKGVIRISKWVAALHRRTRGAHTKDKFIDHLAFGSYLKKIPDAKTPMDWLSVNDENVSRYIADPLCGFMFTVNGFETLFELLWRLYDPDALAAIPKDLPVLFISGTDDPVGNYGAAVREVYDSYRNGLGLFDVTLELIPGQRHEVLNEKGSEKTYQFLYDWLIAKQEKTEG